MQLSALSKIGSSLRFATVAIVGLLALGATTRATVTIAGWDVGNVTGTTYGPQGYAADTLAANLTSVGLTRGSGVGTTGTAAAKAWGGTNWSGGSEAAAITAGDYFTFSLTAASGFDLDLSSISTFDYRRSSTGPSTGEIQYSVNGGSFVDLVQETWATTTGQGNALSAINLSGVAALQNASSVTFRIVNWGGASGGTFYIGNLNASGDDLALTGSVVAASAVPEPSTYAAIFGVIALAGMMVRRKFAGSFA